MKINYKAKSKKDLLVKFLSIVNQLSPSKLTDAEIDLMVQFSFLPEKYKYAPFSSSAKNRIQEANLSLTRTNLNNKLYTISKKGFLRRDEDNVLYFPKYLTSALDSINASRPIELNFNLVHEEKD